MRLRVPSPIVPVAEPPGRDVMPLTWFTALSSRITSRADSPFTRSDSAEYSFRFNGAERHPFVRMSVENAQWPNAFQAYDEGSLPFTRSNRLAPAA